MMMTMMMMEMMMMTIMTTTIMMMMTTLMMMMVIMPTWREEEVVGEAVHAARVLHEVGRHPATVENGSRSRRSSQFQVKEKVGYENRHSLHI